MGNKLARTTQVSPSEYYLSDLPSSDFNLVFKESLGSDRFFKTILCVHDEGLVVVKVYFKRGDFLDLKDHARKLNDIRDKLRNIEHSHVWPFQIWHETDKAAYLLRQYFANSLHDRFSTYPSLSMIEKKWLAFQLLHAVKQSHDRGVCHGDIKCENVLLTSWGWLYLTDYASFKPTYIPDDNPSDFSFFFDAGGRRRCYLAPERFYDPKTELSDSPLRPSMDMFSLGCVIAELFLEGQALFDLSQLLAYRKKLYDPKPSLEKIADVPIRNMILQMIHLNPESRLSCDEYLDTWSYDVFPGYFSLLHKLFSCFPGLESDGRVAVIQGLFPELRKQMIRDAKVKTSPANPLDKGGGKTSPRDADQSSLKPGIAQPKARRSKQDLVADINNLMTQSTQQARRIENSSGCSYRLKAAALQMAEAAPIYEVSEEVYENSLRESDATFGDTFYTLNFHNYSGKTCRKEEVSLPADGGWTWDGDWEIDYKWCLLDANGWRYCKFNVAEDGRLTPAAWAPAFSFDCLWKQRKWIRKRVKRFCQFQLPEGGTISPSGERSEEHKCEGMVLVAAALCACLRHVKHPFTRRVAVQVLQEAAMLCDDDARLQLVVPYVAAMLPDPAAIVRCAALQTLCNVLWAVRSFSPSDAKVFSEYIFPLLSMLPDDPEETVRICYANCIYKFANTAYRFLCERESADGTARQQKRLDAEVLQLREMISRIIHDLVMGQKQTPTIRRALLQNISSLCEFFGKKQCNDFLLPVLPAFLNDRDKQLRALFFEQIVHVCIFVGEESAEAYLLPYLEQALTNVEETVCVNALECLTALCVHRMLKRRVQLKTVERVSPLLCLPSQWVRKAAISLVAASASILSPADGSVYLLPLLSPFLRREPPSISSETDLLACLKPPVSRDVFQRVISDVMRALTSVDVTKDKYGAQGRANPKLQRPKAQPGEAEDGEKLKAMDGYIRNLSSTMHSWELENPEKLESSGGGYDISTDGIPLYSRPQRLDNSTTEEWNRVNRQVGGPIDALAYSQWSTADASERSMITFPSKYVTASVYGGTHLGSRRDGARDHGFPASSASIMPFKAPSDANLNRAPVEPNGEGLSEAFMKYLEASAAEYNWRPRGVLVASLQEHHRAVNQVAVSEDNVLFASASDDGLVKVWDCRRIERDTSFKSKLSYSFGNQRALRLAMLPRDHQVAAASSGGEIHVFCVGYTARVGNNPERYTGVSNIRKIENHEEGAILTMQTFNADDSSMLLYSTQRNGIHLWDFRSQGDAWLLKGRPEQGYISSVALDPAHFWLVSGTSRGVLTLWDLRFQVQVHSWQLPSYHPVEAMSIPSSNRSSLSRPFVYVAAGRDELAIWNVENGSCQRVLKANGQEVNLPATLPQWRKVKHSKPAELQREYRVEELTDPANRVPGFRAILPTSSGTAVLGGGTDCRIRLWDHLRPDGSYCVCGPTVKNSGAFKYSERKLGGVHVTQESGVKLGTKESGAGSLSEAGAAANDVSGCHRDAITCLAVAETNQRLLISSSRDGLVKVWQ